MIDSSSSFSNSRQSLEEDGEGEDSVVVVLGGEEPVGGEEAMGGQGGEEAAGGQGGEGDDPVVGQDDQDIIEVCRS